jgi:hypothetical protein
VFKKYAKQAQLRIQQKKEQIIRDELRVNPQLDWHSSTQLTSDPSRVSAASKQKLYLEHQRKARQEREDVLAERRAGLINTEGFRTAIAAIDDQIVRMDACRRQMIVSAAPTRWSTWGNTFRSIRELWPTIEAYFRDRHGTANQKAGWRDRKLKTYVEAFNDFFMQWRPVIELLEAGDFGNIGRVLFALGAARAALQSASKEIETGAHAGLARLEQWERENPETIQLAEDALLYHYDW